MYLLLKHVYTTFLILCLTLLTSTMVSAQGGGGALCNASITVDGRTVLCRGETTTLRANTRAGLTYEWLRDGTVLPGQVGDAIQVSEAGRYQVRVSGPDCGTNTSSETEIAVNELPPPPNFLVSPTGQQCASTPLTFSVNAPQPDVIYTWIFGDGATARGPEVNHTYDSKGVGTANFIVKVIATNPTGCEADTLRQIITVRNEPEIDFSEENDFQICLPDTVADEDIEVFAVITNETVAPYLGDIRTYFVDWGNGEQEQYSPGNFPVSNPTAYDTIGVYPITIRAVAGNGCEVIFAQDYVVSREPKANFTIDNKERVDENQIPPCVPVLVTPADSSSGGNLSYEWSIEPEQGFELESGTLTSKDPVFRFNESGVYNIELVVTNDCGSDTTSQSVVVGWPQVQLPASITECGPTTIDYSSSGAAGGGSGGLLIDKNLGEQVTVTITITGPTSVTRTFNSDTFDFEYEFARPGRYTVAVEAVNECGSSDDIYGSMGGQSPPVQEVVILQQPAAPSVQGPGTVCAGDIVTLTPTSPGPDYVWFDSDDPNATPIFTGTTFSTPSLTADVTYYVAAIDDANGITCVGPRTPVAIRVVPEVANNIIEGDPVRNTCKGETPAALTGSAPTGGDTSTPYLYTWQISTTSANTGFTDAPGINNAPNYTPTQPITTTTWFRRLVFSGNCSASASNVVEVVAVDPVPAAQNTISEPQQICEGETPAPLIGTRPSGGGGAPYEISWEVSTQGATTGFAAAPGVNNGVNYTPGALTEDTWFRRKVTSGGCTAISEAVKITVLPELANNTIGADQEVCLGTAPAPLAGSAPTGGAGPGSYTYLWQSSTASATIGFVPATGNNSSQSYAPGPVTRTTWFRRVVTSAACAGDTSAVVIITTNPGIVNNSITADQTICAGEQPAQLTGSTPTGGTGAFTYLWQSSTVSPTAGFVNAAGNSAEQNYQPNALTQNTWFRRLVTSTGCTDTSEVVAITIIPAPAAPELEVRNATACVGESAVLSISNPNGETYEWYDVATGGSPIFIGPAFQTPNLTQAATYFVQAVSTSGCASSTRTTATVTVVTPQADAGEDVTIIQGRTIELRASGGETYLWEPAEGLSNPDVASPVASPDKTTTYTVTVTTAEGCVDTDEVTVEVIPAITVPNAFTPNRDGVNEVWEIENIGNYPNARVEVFNRWGNLIFTSNGYGTPWDGTYNGEDLPVATYYYMIYLNSSEEPISGHVTIIR